MPDSRKSDVERVGRFGLVGIINTLIDVVILNVLKFKFGMGVPFPANIISTSAAMTFSFFANRQMVFHSKQRTIAQQALIFLLVTGFGLYVLQSGVIKLLTDVWTWPLDLAVQIVSLLGLDKLLGEEFVRLNGAKAAAILTSMVWNYNLYKKVVFKK